MRRTTQRRPIRRRATEVALTSALFVVALAAPAAAHVTIDPTDVPADGYATVALSVPHGCGEAPTNELAVQLDQGVQSVRAQAIPGWAVEYVMADLDEPYDNHGTEITEYVAEITWTATGDPLAIDQYMTFGITAKWPNTEGETLLIPAVQRCTDGSETAWIEEDEDSEHPAPALAVVAAAAEGHHDDDTSDMTVSDGTEEAAPISDSGESDDSSSTLAIVALIVAGLALVGSAFAVVSARRS